MGRAFEFRKARKMKRWANMAVTFTRIGKDISMAVKEGGPDPATNSRLRVAIQNAKTANMPKDNVERAIQKAVNKEMDNVKEIVYEGYGPHKVAIVVETTTDNHNRTVANIRSYFNKCGGSLGTSGSLDFLFDRKSMFKVKKPENLNLEDLELELIDFGLDEIFEEDDNIVIYAAVSDFGQMQKAIEERQLEIVSAEFERIPTDTKQLTEDQQADVEKLLDKLEEDEDVVKVFHNMG
jgi:YebC/PmpR family DNA-binding regulatory protein